MRLGILPFGECGQLGVVGGAEVVGLDAAGLVPRQPVHVNRDEQIGPGPVGDGGTTIEFDIDVRFAGHCDPVPVGQQLAHPTGDVEREVLLGQSFGHRTGGGATMTRIEHDSLDGQREDAEVEGFRRLGEMDFGLRRRGLDGRIGLDVRFWTVQFQVAESGGARDRRQQEQAPGRDTASPAASRAVVPARVGALPAKLGLVVAYRGIDQGELELPVDAVRSGRRAAGAILRTHRDDAN